MNSSIIELPQYPNVDPFNYELMKKVLIEKLDSFAAAPFTIQRISELLSDPRKQYSRIDKFMRAVEKTILVVSTVPPGRHRSESENGDSLDSALNGDFATEVNVDVEMEAEGSATVKELADGYKRPDIEPATPAVTVSEKVTPAALEEGETSKESETKLPGAEQPKETESAEVAVKPTEEASKSPEKLADKENPTVISSPSKEDKPKVEAAQESAVVDVAQKAQEDELSNKPILPTDNDILVDTSAIPNEPTPLAALENIVAIRTETVVEATETVEQTPTVIEAAPESETKVKEVVSEPVELKDDAELESKRLKLSESEAIPETEEKTDEVAVPETVPESLPAVETIVEEAPAPEAEVTATVALPIVELPEVGITANEPIAAEPLITEPVVIAEIPIETAPVTEDIAEASTTDMETVPTVVTENTMSLDEDEPPTIELEMTPIASKMDTDEPEAAPMDCEDEAEPMDQ